MLPNQSDLEIQISSLSEQLYDKQKDYKILKKKLSDIESEMIYLKIKKENLQEKLDEIKFQK